MCPNTRQEIRRLRFAPVFISLCTLLVLVAPVLAQAPSGATGESSFTGTTPLAERPDTYGPVSSTAYTIGAYDFNPFDSANTYVGTGGTGDRHMISGGAVFLAPVHIPAGAVISTIEIQGCDTNAGGNITATLYSNTTSGGVQSETNHGSVSTSGSPGCGFFGANFVTAPTVDNLNRTYYVQVGSGTTDATTRFSAVRLFYQLQVSPAPLAASFTDVPTSDFAFQFIEAFKAAGVTVGCNVTPARFCPDNNVTRREMAVFFAKALGLHFAP